MLDVRSVLESRYPSFFQRHARSAHTLSRFLGFLFYQSRFEQFGRDYPHLRGFDFVDATLNYFDFTLKLRDNERVRIPTSGRVVIAANHPIGSLDGLALLSLVRQVRPDVKVVANDLLTAIEPLHPVLLPVNNMGGGTARQNLKAIRQHLEQDGALIIFPAGEVSRFGAKGVKDGEWQSGFIKIASATRSPVLPVFVAGRNSLFFYSLSFLARPLSTLWLVREMFKQSHNAVEARVGKSIPYDNYAGLDLSARKLAQMFRKHVYRIARDRSPVFRSVETVAAPENPLLLKRELAEAENLGATVDGKQIVLCRMDDAPCVMREIGRLRELTFRSVGEGTGRPRDIDRFDRDYRHLVLWDAANMEIAGAYRLGDAPALLARGGMDALYTHTLFEFGPGMRPYLEQGLELGRSFVQPKYQTRHSLDYLWQGIGAFLRRNPGYRYLYGPASISRLYGSEAIARIAWHYGTHYPARGLEVAPRSPFTLPAGLQERLASECAGLDREQDLKALRDTLAEQGLPLPVLYKHYAQALEPDGVVFTAFNVDHDFGDCVDAFVLADLTRLTERKRRRYLGAGAGDDSAT
ncbi:lysophospholipid acyltransferase family protein [Parahaliea aestuarii]|uniref:L-ornithine N(alpha)-acyltransferase n=1 Tax=Parahaliea aestuarii TaxID=1852021 RepID=A0A5C8ZXW3_9GAMM|nr:GNAT family N-acyltransferase [Parahaliea aestuarii]TXS93326.1 lysophospholipid acyltransferase family protein [Parahaliea aestuarii]